MDLDSWCLAFSFSGGITLWPLGIGPQSFGKYLGSSWQILTLQLFFSKVYVNLRLLNTISSSCFKTLCLSASSSGRHFCARCYYHSLQDSVYFTLGGHLPGSPLFYVQSGISQIWGYVDKVRQFQEFTLSRAKLQAPIGEEREHHNHWKSEYTNGLWLLRTELWGEGQKAF